LLRDTGTPKRMLKPKQPRRRQERMRRRNRTAWFSLIVLVFRWPVSGQPTESPTAKVGWETSWDCANDYLERNKHAVKLSSRSILARAVERRPIGPPVEGVFTGAVGVQLVVGTTGEVVCARVKTGNSLAISAAIDSLQSWKFRPVVDAHGQMHVFYGEVNLPLR
jgi:hypothetical protein